MKKLLIAALAMIMLMQFVPKKLTATNDTLHGKWAGIFMGHYKINFEFKSTKSGGFSGRLTMFDGSQQIQDDKLSRITYNGQELQFFIQAKSTPFTGAVDFELKQISGNFKFPDGTLHPVQLYKIIAEDADPKFSDSDLLYSELSGDLLRIDVFYLFAKLSELHPKIYAYSSKAEFNDLTNSIADNIANAESVINFYSQVSQLTDLVGCSHTGIRLPGDLSTGLKEDGNYLPLKLYFENGKAFYVSGAAQYVAMKPGSEITAINDRKIADIIDQALTFIPAEGNNHTTKYNSLNKKFPDYFILIDNSPYYEIDYFDASKKVTKKVKVAACKHSDLEELYQSKDVNMSNDFPVDFNLNKGRNTGVLRISSFAIRDINYYINFMDSVITLLNSERIGNLIIDLRDNSGGHPIFAAQLFSYFANQLFIYFDENVSKVEEFAPLYTMLEPNPIHYSGSCYVLVNGGCLSTTGHLISLLKYHQLATFVGEEPGSSFTCNDNSKQFILPSSGIELNVPTKIFTTAVDTANLSGNIIDFPIRIEISDNQSNRDKYMDVTMGYITNSVFWKSN